MTNVSTIKTHVLTINRDRYTLERLFPLEAKLLRMGAVIRGWNSKIVEIIAADETVMHVGMFLYDNDFHCRVENR